MANGSWTTLESDPGLFTDLIATIGVRGVQVEELWTTSQLTDGELKDNEVYGLIFLFKWQTGEKDDEPVEYDDDPRIFFAQQVINNACATQAILSVLLNSPDIDLGDHLRRFQQFTHDFPPELKGVALSNEETIRTAHNSFARPEPFVMDERHATSEDDVYHFIAYVFINGFIYELDGLKQAPIRRAPSSRERWLRDVEPVVRRRMERYALSEIGFNLLAVCKNKRDTYQQQLVVLRSRARAIAARLRDLGGAPLEDMRDDDPGTATAQSDVPLPSTLFDLQNLSVQTRDTIAETEAKLSAEKYKAQQWKVENIRRKHNYLPFLVSFLKLLGEKGKLEPLVELSKRKQKDRAAAAAAAAQK